MSNEYQDWKRDEIFELKQELITTRKALDVAEKALVLLYAKNADCDAFQAIKEINEIKGGKDGN